MEELAFPALRLPEANVQHRKGDERVHAVPSFLSGVRDRTDSFFPGTEKITPRQNTSGWA